MFESEGKLSARIVALNEPKTAAGKEKTDIYNPDPKNVAIRWSGLSSYLALQRKVTLAGRTGRFTLKIARFVITKIITKSITICWKSMEKPRLKRVK
jgi:hypothetical protein